MFWLISLLFISQIIGQLDYFYYPQIFGLGGIQCPDLHIFRPDMHPHQCVSYAFICKGVTEIKIITVANSTQYVCHLRFQPFGAGTPTTNLISFHCGQAYGVSLVMEKQIDGHYRNYCKDLSRDLQKMFDICILPQISFFRCQICKRPFFGYLCSEVENFYDQHSTDPMIMCPDNCLECSVTENTLKCKLCRHGYSSIHSGDGGCLLDCKGHISCKLNDTMDTVYSPECKVGYRSEQSQCFGPSLPCEVPIKNEPYCQKCVEGFYLIQDFLDNPNFVR